MQQNRYLNHICSRFSHLIINAISALRYARPESSEQMPSPGLIQKSKHLIHLTVERNVELRKMFMIPKITRS